MYIFTYIRLHTYTYMYIPREGTDIVGPNLATQFAPTLGHVDLVLLGKSCLCGVWCGSASCLVFCVSCAVCWQATCCLVLMIASMATFLSLSPWLGLPCFLWQVVWVCFPGSCLGPQPWLDSISICDSTFTCYASNVYTRIYVYVGICVYIDIYVKHIQYILSIIDVNIPYTYICIHMCIYP